MPHEVFAHARRYLEHLMPPAEAETFDGFIASVQEKNGKQIEAAIQNRPIAATLYASHASLIAAPYYEEYITVYTFSPPSGRTVRYVEQYDEQAVIPYEEIGLPTTPQKRRLLENRCLVTARHRLLRARTRIPGMGMSLLKFGRLLTEEEMEQAEKLQIELNIQPFRMSDTQR